MENFELAKNVNMHVITNNKFKTFIFRINMLLPIKSKKEVNYYRLLSIMMDDRTNKYDCKEKKAIALGKLYGAKYRSKISVNANVCNMSFQISTIASNYVKEDTFKECMNFLKEAILHPLKEKNSDSLSIANFEEAKKQLKNIVAQLDDDPSIYIEKIFRESIGGALRNKVYPSIREIDETTIDDINKAYDNIINDSKIEIFSSGVLNIKEFFNYLKEDFLFKGRDVIIDPYFDKSLYTYQDIKETRDLSQSEVLIGFDAPQCLNEKDLIALSIGNGIFGSFSTSKLFQEVREKRSLCYSIYSVPGFKPGVMYVRCSLDKDNINEMKLVTLAKLKEVQNGEFDDELLETTKAQLVNQYQKLNDDSNDMLDLYADSLMYDYVFDENNRIDLIHKTTKDDIVDIFKKITYKNIITLEQEG